ncbi:hypothetical protein F4824DRAFT_514853 [Ustulina deusta]|nr:hypothetical protein F4824DRAFT_514853 [Ustulina deusta]
MSDDNGGLPAELPLSTACMMLGNFEAYRALDCEEIPNNGILHAAAFLALPRFVQWLLAFHDPNEKVPEEYDQMVLLALACTSMPNMWCKIAREEASFTTRRQLCTTILAPITKCQLANVVEALKVRQDPERNVNYLYQDKNGIEYSLDEYVLRRLEGVGDKEKQALVAYLRQNKIQSLYFRRAMPGEGAQPKGYRGLPPAYDKAWKSYEESIRNPQ